MQLVAEGAVTAALADESKSLLAASQAARDEIRAQGRTAQAVIAQAEAGIEQARSDVAAARSRVEVARADQARTEALLEYGKIKAPFAGVVRSRLVNPGQLTDGNASEPLFTIARIDKLRVVVAVPELESASIDVGDPVEIRLQSMPGTSIDGTVARTAGSLDESTRTLRVEIDLDNLAAAQEASTSVPRLRPGLYATTTITSETHPDAVAIPKAAIVRANTGPAACFVIEGETVRRREVTTGLEENGLAEIRSGLDGTERVVAAGAAGLTDGQQVKVQ